LESIVHPVIAINGKVAVFSIYLAGNSCTVVEKVAWCWKEALRLWSRRKGGPWLHVTLVVRLSWLRRTLSILLLGELRPLIVRVRTPVVLVILRLMLRAIAGLGGIVSRSISRRWIHRSFTFGDLRIGRALCCQGNG
jgi:hypothetical protein